MLTTTTSTTYRVNESAAFVRCQLRDAMFQNFVRYLSSKIHKLLPLHPAHTTDKPEIDQRAKYTH